MQLDQVNNEALRGGASHVIEHACWITRTHTRAAVLTVIASSISPTHPFPLHPWGYPQGV
jgi:hypothetical protein